MRKVLHNYLEYQYESLEELKEDIVKLKQEGFDILFGIQSSENDWRLDVIHTEPNSRNVGGSAYGKQRKYHIFDMYHKSVLEGQN